MKSVRNAIEDYIALRRSLGFKLHGMATSLGQIILFRVLQGLAGGGLQPSSQGVAARRSSDAR